MTAGWSVPEPQVLESIGEVADVDRRAALATIVDVEGRAYRRPGAKMLITDEQSLGSITAGCLEDEVVALGETALAEDRPVLERFDLSGDDEVWGLGIGCNGVIDVFVEPIGAEYGPIVERYRDGDDQVVLTALSADGSDLEVGDRAVLTGEEVTGVDDADADAWPAWLLEELADPIATLREEDASASVEVEDGELTATVFVNPITAPPRLLAVGSGPDVVPVVEFAAKAGFQVTVAGFRGGTATEERFPDADRVISTSPARLTESVPIDSETYVVVMTHNFVDDRLAIDSLLETPTEHIGLMGPDERFEEMLEAFQAEDRPLTAAEIDRIYTPIGLDLGDGSPYGIATSIVGEVLAVHNDREPGHLRERKSPIHGRIELEADD
ncbi:XdhC family protein [Natrinema gelatinilyticum]|uniref:XdhC family protein n=1 Tax=Natrinema gelatinilyticum TaxID=2961571 RepID=UPI0020C37905|nr:XdhC/CoxI family protein [Natrinema gelatinilyticum]